MKCTTATTTNDNTVKNSHAVQIPTTVYHPTSIGRPTHRHHRSSILGLVPSQFTDAPSKTNSNTPTTANYRSNTTLLSDDILIGPVDAKTKTNSPSLVYMADLLSVVFSINDIDINTDSENDVDPSTTSKVDSVTTPN